MPTWNQVLKPFRKRDYPMAIVLARNFLHQLPSGAPLEPNHLANIHYTIAECAFGMLAAAPLYGQDLSGHPEWATFFQALDEYLRIVEQAAHDYPEDGWWQIRSFPATLLGNALKLVLNAAPATLEDDLESWTQRFLAIWPELALGVLLESINAERINVQLPGYLENTRILAELYLRFTEHLSPHIYRHPRSLVMDILSDLTYFTGGPQAEEQALIWVEQALAINPDDLFARQRSQDIRERKLVMEQIRRFNHDANTAIAGLLSNLHGLEHQVLPASAAALVEKIRLGLKRIHGVHRFVQRQQADFKMILVRQEVGHLILAYEDQACFEISGGEDGARLETDPDYFQIVLETLIRNALEAFDRHRIAITDRHIEIQLDPTRQRIQISDNAGGIAPALMGRIFEPYVSSKAIKQTTGLGLSSARNIMETLLEGRLDLTDPQPVGGAAFTIQF